MLPAPNEGMLAQLHRIAQNVGAFPHHYPISRNFPPTMEKLDKIDLAILSALQSDGRLSNARLAEAVGLSETPCARRLKRLESDGYISRYRAVLSRAALGLGVYAFVYVRFAVHDKTLATRFEREIQAIPRIVSCHNVAGSADYVLQIVARDLDDYGTFMRDELRALPGVTSVESALSLREVKPHSGLPLL
jgi:DNA-binding Lrp family transcriptional regulator